ncbi:DUF397 domain-containing protein [Streptomyces sp. UNOB3_S3]|uniref:DUF397 domain-containing protein n=1 Tax=Streptomyces sp. UNOB3_S3 TaxID=2871682 RepID=UPI001E4ED7BB|nr:DUF397 domain-containing protein [Streptomyces sp. UNOB3_S3]MCC3776019.1 DUF397 domain-containing protein [Streptomyces sp. UNOB3_S3]
MQDPAGASRPWRKSSHSGPGNGDCLQVANPHRTTVHIRDSKTAPDGPALSIPTQAWETFIAALR